MQKLAEICIKRPIFASMLIMALVVVGITSYMQLGVDRFPAVDLPTVSVRTTLAGASPEVMESEVTQRVEQAVNTVEGINELRSISGNGSSVVIATLNLNRDVDVAAQDIRDRLSSVQRDLTRLGADPPVVSKFNNDSAPVVTIALSGPRTLRELRELADNTIKEQFERSDGVGEVNIVGGQSRAMNVWVDAAKLAAYQLPITKVREAIVRQNTDVPGGNVTGATHEFALRTDARLKSAQEFNDVIIASVNGQPVRVKDIGYAEDGTKERRSTSRLNGKPTVILEIRRQSAANTIAVIEGIKKMMPRVQAQLPADVQMELIRDQSRYIYNALHEIKLHLILGSALACGVVLLFMRNLRSTFIAGIAIPTSVIATFGMMWLLGFTLNSVTMLALVLMVGVVIDDAIVVLENIFRFVEEKKLSAFDAAREATREIGLAVLATTLSLVVIFIPVSFMSSVSGRFLYQFGLTAAVAVMVSLLVSFTLTPMMSARLIRVEDATADEAHSRSGFYGMIDHVYTWMLRLTMRWRIVMALLGVAAIIATVPLYHSVKQEFVPSDVDEAEFQVTYTAREGVAMNAMEDVLASMEKDILDTHGVKLALGTAGGNFLGSINSGSFHVAIAPHEERVFSLERLFMGIIKLDPMSAFRDNYSQRDVMKELRRKLAKYKDIRISVRNYPSFSVGGAPVDIDFMIRGPELTKLNEYGEQLREKALKELGGFADADTTLRLDKPELRVHIDRERAAALGVNASDIGTALQVMVGGDEKASRYRDEAVNDDYDVQIRLTGNSRTDPRIIDYLYLPTNSGQLIQLSNIATLAKEPSPSRIDRVDRQRANSLRAMVAPGYAQADRIAVLRKAVVDMNMPPAYSTAVTGRAREFEKTFIEFGWAFLLSVIFMYMILASQFESLAHPLTILLSLPVSVPFALFSLWMTGGTLNLYSALGILVLFGVVKKNAILQIDHTNNLRRQGFNRYDAIIQANRDRLRPILMTTLALVAGMLPLWMGSGPGAEERRAVAVVVIGGQTLALLLTLLLTPVVYSYLDDLTVIFHRVRGKKAPVEKAGRRAELAGK